METRLKRQYEDIEQLRTQYRSVQSSYDRQVVEHAAAVNKLNAVEVALKAASEKAQQQEDALSHAQRQKVRPLHLLDFAEHSDYIMIISIDFRDMSIFERSLPGLRLFMQPL